MFKITDESIRVLEDFLRKALSDELVIQGHKNTGGLIESINFISRKTATMLTIEERHLNYGNIIDKGVAASRIPYGGRTGKGGTSKYIQALMDYVRKRAIAQGDKEVKNIAFAIANKHKKFGMPTPGSSRFSSSRKRTGWIDEAQKRSQGELASLLLRLYGNDIQVEFDNFVREWNKNTAK